MHIAVIEITKRWQHDNAIIHFYNSYLYYLHSVALSCSRWHRRCQIDFFIVALTHSLTQVRVPTSKLKQECHKKASQIKLSHAYCGSVAATKIRHFSFPLSFGKQFLMPPQSIYDYLFDAMNNFFLNFLLLLCDSIPFVFFRNDVCVPNIIRNSKKSESKQLRSGI